MSDHPFVFKGFCSTANIAAAFLAQAISSWQQGRRNPRAQLCHTRAIDAPWGCSEERGSVGQRHRAAHRTEPHTHSWHCTTTHAASALSPHCPVPNFCSAASQWVSDLLISLFQTVPMSPSVQLAALLSMAGEEHLLGSSQTASPHTKPSLSFLPHSLNNISAAFPTFVADRPALSMPTHAGPANVPLSALLDIHHCSPETAAADVGLHSQL